MHDELSVLELIEQRYSCRSYADTPIAPQTQAQLSRFMDEHRTGPLGTTLRLGLLAATEEDRQALKGLGTYGFIRGATGFIGAVAPEAARWALEDLGFVLERVVLYATGLGLGTVWLGGTFTKSRFAQALAVGEGEVLPAVVATGYPAARPRGLDTLIRRGARADRRLPWEALFFQASPGPTREPFHTPLTPDAVGPYAQLLEAVRRGPSASNKQPWRIVTDGARWHFYLQRTRGYASRNVILAGIADMQRIDMGIAMCHWQLAAEALALPGRWELADPGFALPNDLTQYVVTWAPA